MKKLSNDENIKNLKKRKILRIFIIIFAILTIALSLFVFFYNISIIFPVISYILTHVLIRYKEKIPINRIDDLQNVKNLLNKKKNK